MSHRGYAETLEGRDPSRPYPLPRVWGVPPNSWNSLESPFGKGGRVARQVQQDAAEVRGVPEIPVFSIPQEWGIKGVE